MTNAQRIFLTGSLKKPLLWVDAASQNAFDTGAGTGIFVAYAAYMSTDTPIIKYACFIPAFNNFVRWGSMESFDLSNGN